jgi:CBS domain-containing protein
MAERVDLQIERNFNPVMLPPNTTVMLAALYMRVHNVSAVLITEGNDRLLGIFTERDAICKVLAEGKDPQVITLSQVMTDNPDFISPLNTAPEIVRLMEDMHCRHLPIVQDNKAIGIVSLLVPMTPEVNFSLTENIQP